MHYERLLFDSFQGEDNARDFSDLIKSIQFEPEFIDYKIKCQKKQRIFQVTSDQHLPRITLGQKVAQKARLHLQQRAFKQSFGLTNQITQKGTIQIESLSYDTQEGYARFQNNFDDSKFQTCDLYAILITYNFSDVKENMKQLKQFLAEQVNYYDHNSVELLHMNHFRIQIKIQNIEDDYKLSTTIHYPKIDFRIQEVKQPNKLVETPLTRTITKQRAESQKTEEYSKQKAEYKFGFLTLDQSKRILPLMASDPLVKQIPLIGVWLYSNDSTEDLVSKTQLIWSVLTEFIVSTNIKAKITNSPSNKQFLLAIFQKYQTPLFFDVGAQNSLDSLQWKVHEQEEFINKNELEEHIIVVKCNSKQNSSQRPPLRQKNSTKQRMQSQISPQQYSPDWNESHCKVPPKPTPLNAHNHNEQQNPMRIQSSNIEQTQLLQVYAQTIMNLQNQMSEMQKAFLIKQNQFSFHQPSAQQIQTSPYGQMFVQPAAPPTVNVNAFPEIAQPKLEERPSQRYITEQSIDVPPKRLNFQGVEPSSTVAKSKNQEIEDLVSAIVEQPQLQPQSQSLAKDNIQTMIQNPLNRKQDDNERQSLIQGNKIENNAEKSAKLQIPAIYQRQLTPTPQIESRQSIELQSHKIQSHSPQLGINQNHTQKTCTVSSSYQQLSVHQNINETFAWKKLEQPMQDSSEKKLTEKPIMVQKSTKDKENININILQKTQSTPKQSKPYLLKIEPQQPENQSLVPMIKYQLNTNLSDESDDETEVARLEAKYLKKKR